jgi:hypothetical protein
MSAELEADAQLLEREAAADELHLRFRTYSSPFIGGPPCCGILAP